MPADRFYYDGSLTPHTTISLEGPEHHHLRVMRITPDETFEIVNGHGSLATAKLLDLGKRNATLEILTVTTITRSPNHIILAIPLMRPSKLELIIEKGTELGADAFYLYPADHSEKESLSPNQLERLHYLCLSALKQSGRLYLPSIEILAHFSELFKTEAATLYGDTRPDALLLSAQTAPRTLFITGPEKGFSSKEQVILSQKATGVKLSPYILRAETAPLAAISILGCKL